MPRKIIIILLNYCIELNIYVIREVLQRKHSTNGMGSYSFAADMWSVGVILYVMLCGSYPFDENKLGKQILQAKYSFDQNPIWHTISNEAKLFIKKLLVVNPKSRLTAKGALSSCWLSYNYLSDSSEINDMSEIKTNISSVMSEPMLDEISQSIDSETVVDQVTPSFTFKKPKPKPKKKVAPYKATKPSISKLLAGDSSVGRKTQMIDSYFKKTV
jgi:serine/threonine protein kinase